MLKTIRALYEANTPAAHQFRYGLLAFDILATLYVIATSFFPRSLAIELGDMISCRTHQQNEIS